MQAGGYLATDTKVIMELLALPLTDLHTEAIPRIGVIGI